MSNLYKNPEYYEIAFSFRDIPSEVEVFEECFRRFSMIPVRSVLELGSGNSPHMKNLTKRGYKYSGLDLSKSMLAYVQQKAKKIGAQVNLIHGNMIDFSLKDKVDFVYILLGSLLVKNTSELLKHFASVARVLKKGGLYFLDWCVQYDSPWASEGGDTWVIEREGVRVKTKVSWKSVNPVEQTFEEAITLDVNDHGKHLTIIGKDIKRAIYPQEFLCIVSGIDDFEFVGWWNNWDLSQPLEKATKIDRPIALLRRT